VPLRRRGPTIGIVIVSVLVAQVPAAIGTTGDPGSDGRAEVTATRGGAEAFGSSISADGRSVAFTSAASTLVPGDTNDAADVFVADVPIGQVRRVSTSSAGEQGDADGFGPAISGDGSTVAAGRPPSNVQRRPRPIGSTQRRAGAFGRNQPIDRVPAGPVRIAPSRRQRGLCPAALRRNS
jgi:hypothetical protein